MTDTTKNDMEEEFWDLLIAGRPEINSDRYQELKKEYQDYLLEPEKDRQLIMILANNHQIVTKGGIRFIIEDYLGNYQIVSLAGLDHYLQREVNFPPVPKKFIYHALQIASYRQTGQVIPANRPPPFTCYAAKAITVYPYERSFTITESTVEVDVYSQKK